MIGPGQAPTQAAVLELRNEQAVVREAYVFLDEKRLLLASELLRQLRLYQQLGQQLDALQASATDAMQAAVMHHGLDGLQVYPAQSLDDAEFKLDVRNFMGVMLVETGFVTDTVSAMNTAASNPSTRADSCSRLFRDIVEQSAVLAGISGNLHRLLAEYRVTERRSRALENIILPEIDQALRDMSSHLEEIELEDAIRVRLRSGQSA